MNVPKITSKSWKSCVKCCWKPEKGLTDYDTSNNRNGPTSEIDLVKHINYVSNIDACIKVNGIRHRTHKYELMKRDQNKQLVVRRGDQFKLSITLKEPYDKTRDIITFLFRCKDKKAPSYSQGTLVAVKLTEECETVHSWSASLDEAVDNTLIVNVRPAPDCIVGIWELEMETKTIEPHTFKWDKSIYIIFNPWCEIDETFMASDEWREESVLNNDGMIWRGSPDSAAIWKYAQFEKDILDCAFYLITNVGKLSGNLRADPINVSRALSAAVNVNDDNGVVFGNWSGNYSSGKSPTYWTGSLDILQQFYKDKRPVKYGQCWVFAGVLTTVCRAVGLPSRVITNFDSAHDSNGSITIDHVVDENGKVVEDYDSIWNFHVWSEVWMKRPDLGDAYNGWQVIDATPQEESVGMYRCGPASVVACKQGDVAKPFDVPFLFSEVNADIVYWQLDKKTDTWKLLKKETTSIGKNISTKAPGNFSRLDLTDSYKYSEETKEERAVYLKAMRQVDHEFSRCYFNESFDDIVFKFEYLDDIVIGENFKVSLKMNNRNLDVDHEVNAVLRVDVLRYTGKFLDSIKSNTQAVIVPKNGSNKVELTISYADYKNSMEANCVFMISCLAQVLETNYQYFDKDDFRIKMPNLEIDLRNKTSIGKEVVASVKVKNPLPKTLKKGRFLIEAPGLGKQMTINIKRKIEPGEIIEEHFRFVPDGPGNQTVVAKFISKELCDVNGFCHFLVNE